MKAYELMIGDLAYSPFHCERVRITGVMEHSNLCYVKSLKGTDFFSKEANANDFEPIEIDAKMLEANGFKMFNFHDIEGQHQWSWWRDTLTSVSLWCRELNDDPKDGWMIRIESSLATCCHKVEFVHQLQQTLRLCGIDKEITF
jgi:hypothetical protein